MTRHRGSRGHVSWRARRGTVVWAATVAVVAVGVLWCRPAEADEVAEGRALVARAVQVSGLKTTAERPVRLRGRVELFGMMRGKTVGQYTLQVGGPGLWWDMLRFTGWSEMHGTAGNQRWRKRSVANKPLRMYQALHTIDLSWHLRPPAGISITSVSEKKGAPCVSVERPDGRRGELCFDPATGMLASAEYDSPKEFFTFEGSVSAGGLRYPKVLRCVSGAEPAVQMDVEELVPDAVTGAKAFAAPEGAETWPACDAAEPPVPVVQKTTARNPVYTRARRIYGTVMGYAEIDMHGYVQELVTVEARHGVLMKTVQEVTSTWRYQPAKCNGLPMPFETVVRVKFMP